jgi:Ribbon-helix-helix protein, copG family
MAMIASREATTYICRMVTVTLKLPNAVAHRLDELATSTNRSRTELLADAAAALVRARRPAKSITKRMAHLVGKQGGGPSDGATNPKYLEDFGE